MPLVYTSSEDEWYIKAICIDTGMPRTYRKDRIIEELSDSSLLQERLVYHKNQGSKPLKTVQPPRGLLGSEQGSKTVDICFTGFDQYCGQFSQAGSMREYQR